ncbi:MAG TPA: holin [Pseudonocardiaceae bacterium]|nr:holin [Pseudonocardiaceae bacterium]
MFTYRFWQLAGERAVKTFAQTLVAILSVAGVGFHIAPWTTALSTAGMAAVLSVLTSMASAPLGEPGTPSLLPPASRSVPAS